MFSAEKIPYFLTLFIGLLGWALQHSVDRLSERPLLKWNVETTDTGRFKEYNFTFTNLTSKTAFTNVDIILVIVNKDTGSAILDYIPYSIYGALAPNRQQNRSSTESVEVIINNMQPGFIIGTRCTVTKNTRLLPIIQTTNNTIYLMKQGFETFIIENEVYIYLWLSIISLGIIVSYLIFTKKKAMKRIFYLLVFLSLTSNNGYAQTKKFRIINDFDRTVNCKIRVENDYGNTILIRRNDTAGYVSLPAYSDTVSVYIVPASFADYDSLRYDRFSSIKDVVKLTSKAYRNRWSISAKRYSLNGNYAASALIYKELAYRTSFTNKDSSLVYETYATINLAKALDFKGTAYFIDNGEVKVNPKLEKIILKYQANNGLNKVNGKVTYETIETLTPMAANTYLFGTLSAHF